MWKPSLLMSCLLTLKPHMGRCCTTHGCVRCGPCFEMPPCTIAESRQGVTVQPPGQQRIISFLAMPSLSASTLASKLAATTFTSWCAGELLLQFDIVSPSGRRYMYMSAHGIIQCNMSCNGPTVPHGTGMICHKCPCRARRQEAERGQAGYELELWMENMVQLGKSTTKFRCCPSRARCTCMYVRQLRAVRIVCNLAWPNLLHLASAHDVPLDQEHCNICTSGRPGALKYC